MKEFNYKKIIKNCFQDYFYVVVFLYIVQNIFLRLKFYFNFLSTISGATHNHLSINDSVKYIENVFFDYKRIANIDNFFGNIAELGSGDSDGVGIMFLGDGACKVDLIDKFYSKRNGAQQENIKKALIEKYSHLKNIINSEDNSIIKKIKRFYGKQASGEKFFKKNKNYDFIVSRSVLEHVDNPKIVIQNMFEALKENGKLIHKIDLRDHGMFSFTKNSLKFLEIPDYIYGMIAKGTGYPNRFMFHEYKAIFANLQFKNCEFYIAGLHGIDDDLSKGYKYLEIPLNIREKSIKYVESNKNKFCKRLQKIDSLYLSISSFFVVCKK